MERWLFNNGLLETVEIAGLGIRYLPFLNIRDIKS
jgi:hypothetical protein